MSSIISVVICYNNAQEVYTYAQNIDKLNNSAPISLVVVINSASSEDRTILDSIKEAVSFTVMICEPKGNLGYMKGLIFGYECYKRRTEAIPDYVIMGNTDIEIADCEFFNKLSNTKYKEDYWCIGPSVYTKETHNYDNPISYFRRSVKEIDSLIFRFTRFRGLYVLLSLAKAKLMSSKEKKSSSEVYEVHGCFFILKGDCAEHLSEHYFEPLMYSEETYIAEIIYENQKKEYYDSNLEVIHLEHTVTGKLNKKKIAYYLAESMKYIKKEFY